MALLNDERVCDGCGRQALLADGVVVTAYVDAGAHYCQDCRARHQVEGAVVEQDGRRVFRAELDRAAEEPEEDDDAPRRRRARDED